MCVIYYDRRVARQTKKKRDASAGDAGPEGNLLIIRSIRSTQKPRRITLGRLETVPFGCEISSRACATIIVWTQKQKKKTYHNIIVLVYGAIR